MNMKYGSFAAALVLLTACAVAPTAYAKKVVYNPPPPPASFSLDISVGPDNSYSVAGKNYSFRKMEGFLKAQIKHSAKPYTVLFHDPNGDMKVPAYFCFVVLMHDTGADGYVVDKGKPYAVKVTIAGNQYKTLRHQCWTE